jgi:hypothetical protein
MTWAVACLRDAGEVNRARFRLANEHPLNYIQTITEALTACRFLHGR